MISFVFNLLLAVIWAALIGSFNLTNLFLGFAVGALVIWVSRYAFAGEVYLLRVARILRLLAWALTEFARAAIIAAFRSLVPPRPEARQKIEMSLSLDREEEIAALTVLMSVLPGSVPNGLSTQKNTLSLETETIAAGANPALTERKIERWLLSCLR